MKYSWDNNSSENLEKNFSIWIFIEVLCFEVWKIFSLKFKQPNFQEQFFLGQFHLRKNKKKIISLIALFFYWKLEKNFQNYFSQFFLDNVLAPEWRKNKNSCFRKFDFSHFDRKRKSTNFFIFTQSCNRKKILWK